MSLELKKEERKKKARWRDRSRRDITTSPPLRRNYEGLNCDRKLTKPSRAELSCDVSWRRDNTGHTAMRTRVPYLFLSDAITPGSARWTVHCRPAAFVFIQTLQTWSGIVEDGVHYKMLFISVQREGCRLWKSYPNLPLREKLRIQMFKSPNKKIYQQETTLINSITQSRFLLNEKMKIS